MTFRSRTTLTGGCSVAVGDTPGQPAGTRFVGFGEQAESSRVNRASSALAENTDCLRSWLTCGPTGSGCDYEGASAIEDAIDAITDAVVIYVRAGTYTFTGNVELYYPITFIGEGVDSVTWNLTGYSLTVTGGDLSIENIRLSTPTGGVTVQGEHVSFRNVHLVNGGLILAGAKRFLAENCYIYPAVSEHGLTLNGSVQQCSFQNVEVHARNGFALTYQNANEAAFVNCTFNSAAHGCVGSYLGIECDLSLVFIDCAFTNDAVGWYYETFVEFRCTAAPFSYEEGGVRLENCKMVDVWCQGYSSASPPAGNGIPVIYFSGVTASNLLIVRTGLSDDIQDGPLIQMRHSKITRLQVRYENPASHSTLEAASSGLIEVLEDSLIEDMHVADFGGAVSRPILYLKGKDTMSAVLEDNIAGKAIVRVCKLDKTAGGTAWRDAGSSGDCLVAHLAGDALLSGLEFNGTSAPISSTASNALIYMSERHNVLDDSRFYLDESSGGYNANVANIIQVQASYSTIQNCRFYVVPNGSGDRPAFMIYGGDANSTYCVHIRDCILKYAGDTIATDFPIYTVGYLWKVLGCHIQTGNCVAQPQFIHFEAAVLSGPTTGPGGGAIAQGNTLQAASGTTAPVIYANGGFENAPGDEDNLLYYGSTPTLAL